MKTLTNPTDDELNAAFAEHVVGDTTAEIYRRYLPEEHAEMRSNYCQSMDAVLPWLEKEPSATIRIEYKARWNAWAVAVDKCAFAHDTANWFEYEDKSLPRACVIALLRANGVEAVFK